MTGAWQYCCTMTVGGYRCTDAWQYRYVMTVGGYRCTGAWQYRCVMTAGGVSAPIHCSTGASLGGTGTTNAGCSCVLCWPAHPATSIFSMFWEQAVMSWTPH